MKIRNRAFICVGSISILLSLSFILLNIVFNGHIHKIENGILLFHAHPYQRNHEHEPVKNHHHTKFELFIYDRITHLLEFDLSIYTVWIFLTTIVICIFTLNLHVPLNRFTLISLIRAPPIKLQQNKIFV